MSSEISLVEPTSSVHSFSSSSIENIKLSKYANRQDIYTSTIESLNDQPIESCIQKIITKIISSLNYLISLFYGEKKNAKFKRKRRLKNQETR